MTSFTLAMVGFKEDTGWRVGRYAFLNDLTEGEKPRDGREALGYIERLIGETSTWVVGEKPPADAVRFFDVIIGVGGESNRHSIDYHKYDGCPMEVISDGMEIYRIIRREGIRPSIVNENRRRAEKTAERKRRIAAEKRVMVFDIGRSYRVTGMTDRFGHKVEYTVLITGREGPDIVLFDSENVCAWSKVRRYEDGSEYFTNKNLTNGVVRASDVVEGGVAS